MDNNYNNLNFIDDGDLRPQTTDSQTNVYDNNNDCPMMTNTSANATASSHSYPITSSDSPRPLPQQQIQQPVYQQNIENNIQQPFSNITQPIPQNVAGVILIIIVKHRINENFKYGLSANLDSCEKFHLCQVRFTLKELYTHYVKVVKIKDIIGRQEEKLDR
uniref:Uncharacterized protein n=1 Tax=Rhizophagus irregularis (strain DAOM 181602 / DAOM 197198 / MUCL 43194) TaxID=747089 RepID=U9UTK6_RHIID